jgi:hypothetical protein
MLEAHVTFELAAWTGEAGTDALATEVAAALDWLADLRLAEVVSPSAVGAAVDALPVTDELVELVAQVLLAGRRAEVESPVTVGDVVRREDVDAVAAWVVDAEELRGRAVTAVTTSEAYTRLVAHVLYHGVKSYVLTENVFARKIPGASSLVRLGQRGLNAAAPQLEAGVDRQLTAFVQANVADTLKESRRYLDRTLDAAMLTTMVEDAWRSVRDGTVGELADAVPADDLRSAVRLLGPMVRQAGEAGLLAEVAEAGTAALLEQHGDRPVADLLADLGLSRDLLVEHVVALAGPVLERAVSTGLLEARIRSRLQPFYEALPTLVPGVAPSGA